MDLSIFRQLTFRDVVQAIVIMTSIVLVVYVLRLFVGVILVNRKIDRMYRKRDKEVEQEHIQAKNEGVAIAVFEAKKQQIFEKYEDQIKSLKRKKSYMFDILPFISKK